jgi:hypothetical protein
MQLQIDENQSCFRTEFMLGGVVCGDEHTSLRHD